MAFDPTRRQVRGGEVLLREVLKVRGAGTAPVVAEQVGGDAKEVAAAGNLALGKIGSAATRRESARSSPASGRRPARGSPETRAR